MAANGSKNQAFHTCAQATPGNLQKQWKFMCFVHVPPKGGPDQYNQNLINRPKPFKNLVKMNNSTVWSLPTAAQRASGPRHARAERGLRAKCATWKSLKNHRETLCFQCAPWVRQFCHDDVLCSKGQHVCMCGMHDSTAELIPKLIKSRVM